MGAELEVEITAPTELEFQIAVAPHPNTDVFESLSFVLDGKTVQPLERVWKGVYGAWAGCQGRRPGGGARRRAMRPIMALTMASE